MARSDDLIDTGLAIYVLRDLLDWTQADLGRASGIDKGLISEYEQGKRKPSRRNLGRLAEALGLDLEFFGQIALQCRGIRQSFEKVRSQGRAGAAGKAEAAPDLEETIVEAVRKGVKPFLLQLFPQDREPAPREEDRAWAEARWSRMATLAAEDQRVLVDVLEGDERSWAVAERLCRASEAVAAERPGEALRLARLAIQLAEQSPGSESWRRRLRSWCERFVAHASGSPGRSDLKAPLLL